MAPIIGITAPAPRIGPAYRRQAHEQGIWIDARGNELPVWQMSPERVLSLVRFLRNCAAQEVSCLHRFYIHCPEPIGEAALVAFHEEFDYIMLHDDEDLERQLLEAMPIWPYVVRAAEKYGIPIWPHDNEQEEKSPCLSTE